MATRRAGQRRSPHLKNMGPVSTRWLNEIGIHTIEDLASVGAVMAYRILKHQNPSVTLNMLYGLHGALTGRVWTELSPEEKEALRREAEEPLFVRVGNASA